jgi:hypothetical protein
MGQISGRKFRLTEIDMDNWSLGFGFITHQDAAKHLNRAHSALLGILLSDQGR